MKRKGAALFVSCLAHVRCRYRYALKSCNASALMIRFYRLTGPISRVGCTCPWQGSKVQTRASELQAPVRLPGSYALPLFLANEVRERQVLSATSCT